MKSLALTVVCVECVCGLTRYTLCFVPGFTHYILLMELYYYGGSYTTPTPAEHTMQQLGLLVTKGCGLLLRQAFMRMGVEPNQHSNDVALSSTCTDLCRDAFGLA